ncbi:hypothetical protein AMS68_004629 [Peltaster fructicola]|uniref:Uncharacterized protein n=1 Tax=Peltaster fructicola TaxID=286661 RepID=A0A6H0XWG5_9PEZI|nr:hypothetical protein AMS68_004629 [Peltaster fructicola]
MASPRSSPVQIAKSASFTSSEPLPINTSALSQRRDSLASIASSILSERRDSASNTVFEFSSALQGRARSCSKPSAYVSDADLWGLDEVPYPREAPSPPRSAAQWLVRPAPAPVQAPVPATSGYRSRSTTLRTQARSRSRSASKTNKK